MKLAIVLSLVALLHLFFMAAELWAPSVALRKTNKKLGSVHKLDPEQSKEVASIIRNAGVYNGIVAAALFYTAYMAYLGNPVRGFALVLMIGVFAAGVFGAITLRSGLCFVQALCGLAGWLWLR